METAVVTVLFDSWQYATLTICTGFTRRIRWQQDMQVNHCRRQIELLVILRNMHYIGLLFLWASAPWRGVMSLHKNALAHFINLSIAIGSTHVLRFEWDARDRHRVSDSTLWRPRVKLPRSSITKKNSERKICDRQSFELNRCFSNLVIVATATATVWVLHRWAVAWATTCLWSVLRWVHAVSRAAPFAGQLGHHNRRQQKKKTKEADLHLSDQ